MFYPNKISAKSFILRNCFMRNKILNRTIILYHCIYYIFLQLQAKNTEQNRSVFHYPLLLNLKSTPPLPPSQHHGQIYLDLLMFKLSHNPSHFNNKIHFTPYYICIVSCTSHNNTCLSKKHPQAAATREWPSRNGRYCLLRNVPQVTAEEEERFARNDGPTVPVPKKIVVPVLSY